MRLPSTPGRMISSGLGASRGSSGCVVEASKTSRAELAPYVSQIIAYEGLYRSDAVRPFGQCPIARDVHHAERTVGYTSGSRHSQLAVVQAHSRSSAH